MTNIYILKGPLTLFSSPNKILISNEWNSPSMLVLSPAVNNTQKNFNHSFPQFYVAFRGQIKQ